MSNTTEAMRAALLDIAREVEALKRPCSMDNPESAVAIQNSKYMGISYKLRALAAAPALADSTHTGAVPDAADLATHSWPIHEGGMRLGVPSGVLLVHKPTGIGVAVTLHRSQHQNRDEARTRLFDLLAAQPSPERNDCEPVAWRYKDGRGHWRFVRAGRPGYCPPAIVQPEPLYTAPPPPAERHYCEATTEAWNEVRRQVRSLGSKCGLGDLLAAVEAYSDARTAGSTLGVHTCTPPGDDAGGLEITEAWNRVRKEARGIGIGSAYGIGRLLAVVERYGDLRAAAATKAPEGGA